VRWPSPLSRRRLLALGSVSTALAATNQVSSARFFPDGMRALVQEPELESVSVALDWYPNANHAGLYLAQERGYYAEEGLAPEFYTPSDPTTVLQTVGAGRDDFGISYQTDVLLARAVGVPVVSVLALVQAPLQGIMVLADSGITRPRDLVGKTVGYPGIPSQEAFLATMLADDGWGVPPYYELVIAAGESTVSARSELVERFLRATRRGYEAAIADPAAAIAALRAASPDLNVAVEEAGIALLAPAWTADSVPFGTQTAERWDAYAAWMVERGLIPDDLDVAAAWQEGLTPVAAPPIP
jgi:ABC-type nitrate/sulfonate/bicarbonate transport system substrate-binding protein